MTKLTNYRVVREHLGDRLYVEGDTRTAVAAEVAHLVPQTLEPIGEADAPKDEIETVTESKAEPAPANKAEPAPANKVESAPANKAATKGKSPAKGAAAPNKGE